MNYYNRNSYNNRYNSNYNGGYGSSYGSYNRGYNNNYNRNGNSYSQYNANSNYGNRNAQNNRRSSWPKGKKNSNAWIRIIETHNGEKGAIGGAWLFDFYRKALFTIDITPKYSRRDGDSYESVSTEYENAQGRVRYKVKATITNKNTFEKMYATGIYNPDSGKIYFENIDLMVNAHKRTATFNPFNGQFKPQRKYSKN